MNIVTSLLMLVIGLFLLVKGSDVFVDGSSGLARNFNVPNFVIGLTIMAFGTSAPEAFIGVRSALEETAILAVGNVIGSDIFNLIFIIGLAAIITPISINFAKISKDFTVAISGPILLLIMMLIFESEIPRFGGLSFLALFFTYVAILVYNILKTRKTQPLQDSLEDHMLLPRPLKKNILITIIGLICILLGGELTVYHATTIAETLMISPRIIGLTIVAIGTSLPELMIVLSASKRGENELAIGNIIGSSIFNIFFVLGLTGVVTPLPIEIRLIYDLIFLTITALILGVFLITKKKLSRIEGSLMVFAYLLYLVFVIVN